MSTKIEKLRDWLKSECKLEFTANELSNINRLDLSGKNLTHITPEICQLKNLKELYLHNNKITEIPSEIADLKLDYFSCDKMFVKESDKKLIEFLDKFKQEYQIVQETLLGEVLV